MLLRSARAGERAALDQLVAAYQRPLFGFCLGVLDHPEDAEDAVQETFVRALRALDGFRGDALFRTWLFRIALNVCLNVRRARRPAAPWEAETVTDSPEEAAVSRLRVREALLSLLPRHRAVLLLKEREGLSVAEIGSVMGWSPKRAERELSRARQALAAWRTHEEEEGESG
jgi:RNA polymerase sigma-70 factor (ECF subfamily)